MAFDKAKYLFQRDEKGDLISKEVVIHGLMEKPAFRLIPLTKGELSKVWAGTDERGSSSAEVDEWVIPQCCKDPTFTKEEVHFMRSDAVTAIMTAIISLSLGMEPDVYAAKVGEDKPDDPLGNKHG